MTACWIDPLADARWTLFTERHPRASVFHSIGWLDALRRTYGCVPRVLTTTPPGAELQNGLAVCEVRGWRGKRLVSLPFSDHCEPLVDSSQDWSGILSRLAAGVDDGEWTSVELRPSSGELMTSAPGIWEAARTYALHRCDLTPPLTAIHDRFHASCIQRPIRRAEREGLQCVAGATPALLDTFYGLLRMTRRRHGLPPQPIAWFRNLASALRDRLTVRIAEKAGRPIASILTISFGKRLVYKYGCSDSTYHRLGGMPFLFWHAIQDAKARGLEELDLGRSDIDQEGLTTFKDRLGAVRTTLTYYSSPAAARHVTGGWQERAARWMFERLPDPALTLAGRVLYKHLA
jgi:hypothetical protein